MDHLPKLSDNQAISISSEGLEHILKNYDPENPGRNFLWTTDYRTQLPVRVKKQGFGSQKPYTFPEMWRQTVKEFGNNSAIHFEETPNKWITWNYNKYYEECITFGKALIALDIEAYTAVNIIGYNSAQWAVAFSGSILGNYLPVGIYTTNGPDACEYIANHSQAKIIICEDRTHLDKYISVKQKVTGIKYYVVYRGGVPENLDSDFVGRVFTWNQFMKLGRQKYQPKNKKDEIEERMNAAKPGNCCTFIYTSGTTGPPKAVMISHDNYTWVTDAVGRRFEFDTKYRGVGRMLSLLPLSHVAAQLIDLVITIRFGASLYFTDPSVLQGNLVKFLQIAKPTMFMCVPRVWQKIQEKIASIGAQTTGFKRKIADWAKQKAPQGTHAQETGQGEFPRMWGVAKKLVFNKIKENLGLDECHLFIFGAAPLKQSTRQFFLKINIFLHNVYGMSELSGPESFTDPWGWDRFDSKDALREAGKPLDGLQLFIDNPDADGNGQICLRGRNCFMGYFKSEQETKSTIDKKGFVHSGDVGVIMKNGSVAITGRIKQLIITAGGENVAPVLIENQIHTALPIFSSAVVIGDKKKYLTVLLCLRLKDDKNLSQQVIDYISSKGSNAKTIQQAIKCTNLQKIIHNGIQQANKKAISRAQRIIRFKILPLQFTVDNGVLTPTLKLKRKIINEKFKAEIEQMYIQAKL